MSSENQSWVDGPNGIEYRPPCESPIRPEEKRHNQPERSGVDSEEPRIEVTVTPMEENQ